MTAQNKHEELVRVYRDETKSDDVIVEVLGQPVAALKQMKAEPWLLKDNKGKKK
jgi:hypothetical protein